MATNVAQQRGQGQQSASNTGRQMRQETQEMSQDFQSMVNNISKAVTEYGKHHPEVTAGMIFLLGLYVGWKIKPW